MTLLGDEQNAALRPRVSVGHSELIYYKNTSLSIKLKEDASGIKDGRYMGSDMCQNCRDCKEHWLDRLPSYQVKGDTCGRAR